MPAVVSFDRESAHGNLRLGRQPAFAARARCVAGPPRADRRVPSHLDAGAIRRVQAVESISFAHVMHVPIMRPAQHVLPKAVPDARKRAPEVSFARSKAELSANRRKPAARPTAQNAPVGQLAAAPKHIVS